MYLDPPFLAGDLFLLCSSASLLLCSSACTTLLRHPPQQTQTAFSPPHHPPASSANKHCPGVLWAELFLRRWMHDYVAPSRGYPGPWPIAMSAVIVHPRLQGSHAQALPRLHVVDESICTQTTPSIGSLYCVNQWHCRASQSSSNPSVSFVSFVSFVCIVCCSISRVLPSTTTQMLWRPSMPSAPIRSPDAHCSDLPGSRSMQMKIPLEVDCPNRSFGCGPLYRHTYPWPLWTCS
jgi:hypothetical protein